LADLTCWPAGIGLHQTRFSTPLERDKLERVAMIDLHDIFNHAVAQARHALTHNEFLSGGFVLMVIGGLAAWLRAVPKRTYRWVYRHLVLTVEVSSRDDAFDWFRVWLARHPVAQRLRYLELSSRDDDEAGGFDLTEQPNTARKHASARAMLTPITGLHWVRYRGTWFLIGAEREERQANGMLLGFYHTISIQTFAWNRGALLELVREAYRATVRPEERRVAIHVPNGEYWRCIERRKPRPTGSLVYTGDTLEHLIADAKRFFTDEDWYADAGVPWRRGYLLHGPPGNGKSSLVAALAGELGLDVCVLNLSMDTLDDSRLQDLLSHAPERSLVLMEDIDAVFEGRQKPKTDRSRLSFNGVLNALDGVAAQEGRLIFMTTNHRERLDPALIRPGRCDVHVFIGNASHGQIAGMVRRFFPKLDHHLARTLAERVPDETLSMAQIQEYLVRHRDDPESMIRNWHKLVPKRDPLEV
jgi:chaperone BCS1